jgi:hypothetical protein
MIAPLAEIIRKNNQGLALALSQRLALLVPAQAASFQNAMAGAPSRRSRTLACSVTVHPAATMTYRVYPAPPASPALGRRCGDSQTSAARTCSAHRCRPWSSLKARRARQSAGT